MISRAGFSSFSAGVVADLETSAGMKIMRESVWVMSGWGVGVGARSAPAWRWAWGQLGQRRRHRRLHGAGGRRPLGRGLFAVCQGQKHDGRQQQHQQRRQTDNRPMIQPAAGTHHRLGWTAAAAAGSGRRGAKGLTTGAGRPAVAHQRPRKILDRVIARVSGRNDMARPATMDRYGSILGLTSRAGLRSLNPRLAAPGRWAASGRSAARRASRPGYRRRPSGQRRSAPVAPGAP